MLFFCDFKCLANTIHILEELNTKQRKIRSLRGFFLYALEIIQSTDNYQILKTNLKPSFWRNLRTILRQNKKIVLLQFLFGRGYSYQDPIPHLKDQIQALQNQVNSLQDRIRDLETKLTFQYNSKYLLRRTRIDENTPLTSQQSDSTLKSLQSANLLSNDPKRSAVLSKVNLKVKEPRYPISESLSEDSKSSLNTLSHSQQYNPQIERKPKIA